MAVDWGELGPALGGGLTAGMLVWRGFRDLSRKLDHVERIPHIEKKVDMLAEEGAATAEALKAHMIDEAAAAKIEKREREDRQVALDGRLQHMDKAIEKIGGYTPPIVEGTP